MSVNGYFNKSKPDLMMPKTESRTDNLGIHYEGPVLSGLRGVNQQLERHATPLPQTGAQIREIFSLGMGDGRIVPHDYFYYRLYDDSLYPQDEKKRFLSESVSHRMLLKCCNVHWWAAADDKYLAAAILRGYGIAVPETQAVFSRSARPYSRCLDLATSPPERCVTSCIP